MKHKRNGMTIRLTGLNLAKRLLLYFRAACDAKHIAIGKYWYSVREK